MHLTLHTVRPTSVYISPNKDVTELQNHHASVRLGYGLNDQGSRVRFPAGAGNFSLHHHVQNGSMAHPTSYPVGTRGPFPGAKAAGAWSWPLTPSSAEVKERVKLCLHSPISLHSVVLTRTTLPLAHNTLITFKRRDTISGKLFYINHDWLTDWLTDYIQQSPWYVNSHSASQ
jgi:hypothetical protein